MDEISSSLQSTQQHQVVKLLDLRDPAAGGMRPQILHHLVCRTVVPGQVIQPVKHVGNNDLQVKLPGQIIKLG